MLSAAEGVDFGRLSGHESFLAALILPGATVAFPRLSAFALANRFTASEVRDGILSNYVVFGGCETLWSLLRVLPAGGLHADVVAALSLASDPDRLSFRFGSRDVGGLGLSLLGLHPHPFVRAWAAARVPEGVVFDHLSRDANAVVRVSVAERVGVGGGLLLGLARDGNASVRAAVARNPSAPAGALGLLCADGDDFVRSNAALNSGCPPEALVGLVGDGSSAVLLGVVRNPRVPLEALRVLCEHEVAVVRLAASERLRLRLNSLGEGGG